jgi:hypothetical protein
MAKTGKTGRPAKELACHPVGIILQRLFNNIDLRLLLLCRLGVPCGKNKANTHLINQRGKLLTG